MIMYLIPVNPNESFGASDSTNYFSEEVEVVAGAGYECVPAVVERHSGRTLEAALDHSV
jgi:hypothetical protein